NGVAETALQVAFSFERDNRLDAATTVEPLGIDRDHSAARNRHGFLGQLVEVGRDENGCGQNGTKKGEGDRNQEGSHVLSATVRIASAARRLAPGPPSLRRTAASPARICAMRGASVSSAIASRATASGVNASWMSSGTIRSPA